MRFNENNFSKSKFKELSGNTEAMKSLIEKLEMEVVQELDEELRKHFEAIVERLNTVGHSLKLYCSPNPGDISFRDDREIQGNYTCDLRLGLDLFVSAGFSDTVNEDEISSDSIGEGN